MGELQEIRVRLALFGPPGAGKSEALAAHHELTPSDNKGPLTRIAGADGHTLLYDHTELRMGQVGDLPIFVDVYALPGDPDKEVARRIVLSGCNGYIFTADSRGFSLSDARASFQELLSYLGSRNRTAETAALVVLLTRVERQGSGSNRVEHSLVQHVAADRVLRVGSGDWRGVGEAIRKCAALAIARERDELEARRAGKPPPRIEVPVDLQEEIELGHRIYVGATGLAGLSSFSPHSDQFLSQVLLELGAARREDLEEALRLKAQALDLKLSVNLEEILTKRSMVEPDLLSRARRVRSCVEMIHEEVLFGRIATEQEIVPFERIKRALGLQVKRQFQNSLDHLLVRAGHLDRLGRRQVLERLAQIHQGELLRDDEALRAGMIHHTTPLPLDKRRSGVPLFGEVAVNLGLVTRAQVDECVSEQRKLRRDGTKRFIGELMRKKGYLSEDEIPLVCKALEDKIADDRIQGYQIHRSLGRGNMAIVFAATQVNLDRTVALKILDPKLLFDSDFIERFVQEAQAAARLNHANIVQAYDVGSSEDLHYFAMEYVDGVTVKDLIEDSGGLDEDTAVDIIVQMARALEHAAKHKLVHRDVKPGNIMINKDGVAKLCDLGLAKRLDQAGTEETVILGSPYYISPEQIDGRADIDIRADIYSLGATMFHMLTGRPPFTGPTPEEVCLKHLSDPVPDPSRISSTITQRILPILFRMMAKQREHRYATAADVIKDLVRDRPYAGSDERQALLAERIREAYPTKGWNLAKA